MTPCPLDGGRAGDGGADAPLDRWTHERHAPGSVGRARHLRREITLGERVLWKALRRTDLHVRRQAPIGRYVADFAIHAAGLVVEVDGPHHEHHDRAARDAERDAWLATQGYRVLRFPSDHALNHPERLVRQIVDVASAPPSPTLPPSRGKGA